jgi:nicotinic acid mononucleotide adenylyltransferase
MLRIVFVSGHDMVQLTAKWPEWQSVKIHYKELCAAKDFDVVVAARPRERSLARNIAKLLRTKKIEDLRILFVCSALRRADGVALMVPVGKSDLTLVVFRKAGMP